MRWKRTESQEIYPNTRGNLVYNKELEQWDVKEWIGLTSGKELWAKNIWTDGENIYYSTKGTTSSTTMSATTSQQLVLDIETSTWSTMTWNGINDFNGEDIWTDGDNIYLTLYDSGTKHYVLDKSTNTWVTKTWNGFADASPFVYGRYIWTNGEKIYYSDGTDQYVLDKETETWNKISLDGISSLYASSIWRIGDKIYNGSSYELIKHEIYC